MNRDITNIKNDLHLHDCTIYSMHFDVKNYKVLIDIDYIVRWEQGVNGKYRFEISKAHLVFTKVKDIQLDLATTEYIQIDNMQIITTNAQKLYLLECSNGNIKITADDVEVIAYTKPLWSDTQQLRS